MKEKKPSATPNTTIRLGESLKTGTFVRRLNRFMVEAQLSGKHVLAHLPNSGRLVNVLIPEARAFLSEKRSTGRKSGYDLFAVEHSGVPMIVDTRFSTVAAQKSIEERRFTELKGYGVVLQNAKVNHSRLDLLLRRGAKQFFLEIKCVTHVVDGVALFPDAPTLRGRKHIKTLKRLVEQGFDAGILFSVQRPDAMRVRPYREMDPLFARLLREATRIGVKVFTQTLVFKPPSLVEVKTDTPLFSFD